MIAFSLLGFGFKGFRSRVVGEFKGLRVLGLGDSGFRDLGLGLRV